MAISTTAQFEGQQFLTGYEPIMLVEILGTNEFFATRNPGFTGPWLAGEGLIAGAGDTTAIANASEKPSYDGGLLQLVDGGIGDISYSLDAEGLSRTGNTSIEILNQELFHLTLENNELVNAIVRIRLGFFGGVFSDYITIFQGSIEDFRANYESLGIELVDDTVNHAILTPPQFGADFFPQSVTTGRAIPIILGDVNFVPAIDIVKPAESRLAFEFSSVDTSFSVFDDQPGQRFPANGEVTMAGSAAEVVTYNRVKPAIASGVPVLQFSELTRTAPVLHTAGDSVTLSSVELLKVFAFNGPGRPRRARLPDGVHPTSTLTFPTRAVDPIGNDDRIVQALVTNPDEANITASMAGGNRGPNLIEDGEGDNAVLSGFWTVVAGTWVGGFTPAGESEPVLHGQVDAAQGTPSEIRQDITTIAGNSYRLTFSARLPVTDPAPFQQVLVGTTTSPSSIFNFGDLRFTIEQGYDLVFTASEATTRITLLLDNTGIGATPFHGYFDHFNLYNIATDNPATSVRHLVSRHIPGIDIDDDSFTTAEDKYDAENDRLSGLIATTQEAQNLLGRIAEQFRAKTWLNEDGKQKWKVFDNAEAPIRFFTVSDIDKGTFSVTQESVDSIFTHYYVYFNKRNDLAQGSLGGREAYQGVMFATPEDTNHTEQAVLQVFCKSAQDTFRVTRVKEVFCDLVPDAATAARMLDLMVRLHTHRRIIVEFTTYLNGAHIEVTDFVKITHPLIPNFANGVNYEVLEKEIHPNGMMVSLTCAEIRQSVFGSFIEEWEPLDLFVAGLILEEEWNPPPLLLIVSDGKYPFIEQWDNSVLWRGELFKAWESDGGSFIERPLTLNLTASFEFKEAERSGNVYFPVNRMAAPFSVFGNAGKRYRWNRSALAGPAEALNPPVFNAIGGPTAAYPALLFDCVDNNNAGGLIHGSSFINDHADFSISFWVYLNQKPLESMPIIMNLNDSRIVSDENLEDVSYMFFWDATTDRFKAFFYKFTAGGPTQLQGEAWINDLNTVVTGTTITDTVLGAPSVATWYHVVLRADQIRGTANQTYQMIINDGTPDEVIETNPILPSNANVGWTNPRGMAQDLFSTIGAKSTQRDATGRFDGYHRGEIATGGSYFAFGLNPAIQIYTSGTFLGRHPFRKQTGLPRNMGLDGRIAMVNFYSRYIADGDVTNLYNSGLPPFYPFPA